jgi:O-antigen ligase
VIVAAVTIVQFTLVRLDPTLASRLFGESFYTRSYDVHDTALSAVRVHGPLGGAGETAGVLLVAFAFGLLRYSLRRDRAAKTSDVVALVVLGLGVAATLTRAATVGLAILLLAWSVQRQLRSVSPIALRARMALLVAAIALLTLPVLGGEIVQSRFSDANPVASGESFAQGRGQIWRDEIALVRSSARFESLLGHGAHSSYLPGRVVEGAVTEESPHNGLLWTLVETGIIGTAAYLLFLLMLGRAFWAAARAERFTASGKVAGVALAALLAYAAQDMFTVSAASPGQHWYYMLFVGAALGFCAAGRAGSAKGTGRVAAHR